MANNYIDSIQIGGGDTYKISPKSIYVTTISSADPRTYYPVLSPKNRLNSNGDTEQNNICGTIAVTPNVGVTISGNLSITSTNKLFVDSIYYTGSYGPVEMSPIESSEINSLSLIAGTSFFTTHGSVNDPVVNNYNLTIKNYNDITFTSIKNVTFSNTNSLTFTGSSVIFSALSFQANNVDLINNINISGETSISGDNINISGANIGISGTITMSGNINLTNVLKISMPNPINSNNFVECNYIANSENVFNTNYHLANTLVTANAILNYINSNFVSKENIADDIKKSSITVGKIYPYGAYGQDIKIPVLPSWAAADGPNYTNGPSFVATTRNGQAKIIYCGIVTIDADDEVISINRVAIGMTKILGGIVCAGNDIEDYQTLKNRLNNRQSINTVGCAHNDTTFYMWVDRYDPQICNRIYYMIWGE